MKFVFLEIWVNEMYFPFFFFFATFITGNVVIYIFIQFDVVRVGYATKYGNMQRKRGKMMKMNK